MLNTPFSPWPSFTKEEESAVSKIVRSNQVNYWTGKETILFEKEFSEWTGIPSSIALMNGTLALEITLEALGLESGDEVLVTPRSFFASVSCVVRRGGIPVFADVDADSQNVTMENMERVRTSRTRGVICVHLAGWPCEMDRVMDWAKEHQLFVIEDCAQAHGARYRNKSVGAWGDVGSWSFCQDKIMTTGGEGGIVTTHDQELWSRMWSLKDHGKSWDDVFAKNHPPGFRWLHKSFGTNGRMLEMQAALGRIQLKRMPEWHSARSRNALGLQEASLECSGLRTPVPPPHLDHAWYKFYTFVRPEALVSGWSRDRIIEEINQAGVPCYTGSCPEIYLEKAFENTGWRPEQRLPVARKLGETSLMFLVHPTLTEDEIQLTAEMIQSVMRLATK